MINRLRQAAPVGLSGLLCMLLGCGHSAPSSSAATGANEAAPEKATSPGRRELARAQAARPTELKLFSEGVRLLHLGPDHYPGAVQKFEAALRSDPHLFEAHHNLGLIALHSGNHDRAIAELQAAFAGAMAHSQNLAAAQAVVAAAAKKAGATTAGAPAPGGVPAPGSPGQAGQSGAGEPVGISPQATSSLRALVEAYRRAGRFAEARSLLLKQLERSPDDASLRLEYARLLRDANYGSEALEEVRKVLRKDARNAEAYNALGLVYYKLNKLDLAEIALRKAAELAPQRAFVWNNLGLVAFGRNQMEEAFALFDKASRLEPKDVQAHLNKTVVYLDAGDYTRAQSEAQKTLSIAPEQADALVALGVACRGLGKHILAQRAYVRALELIPGHPAALYNLGILFMDHKRDPAQAKAYLKRFLASAPSQDPKRSDAQMRLKELK